MNRLEEIRARLAELKPEIESLGSSEEIGDDEARSLDEKITEFDTLTTELAPLEERAAKIAKIAATEIRRESGQVTRQAPNVSIKRDAFEVLDTRGAGMSPGEYRKALVDGVLRTHEGALADADQERSLETIIKRHASDTAWAEQMLARSRPEYADAWFKMVSGRSHLLTDDEKRAAITVATATAGGYLVPIVIDPTVILTNGGTDNVVRGMSTVKTMTEGNAWKGVTSAGVTASWDGEVVEVSDDTSAFVQPSIPLYKAAAFVQGSIESFQDINGLQGEIVKMFADAKDRLESLAHHSGNGTTAPKGVFTAVAAVANSVITSTTAATIGEVDLGATWDAVPARHRRKSVWLTNPIWDLVIRRLGTAVTFAYSGDLRDPLGQGLYGKPVVLSDDAPEVTTTTALDHRLLIGNFENYYIIDKPGSFAVEYIPHLFNTTTNLPDGRRGLYAYWRNGADTVNADAFRLLVDKTSA